jgi:hypothetical protein
VRPNDFVTEMRKISPSTNVRPICNSCDAHIVLLMYSTLTGADYDIFVFLFNEPVSDVWTINVDCSGYIMCRDRAINDATTFN